MKMSNKFTKSVTEIITSYIDDVGEKVINERTLDKIERLYKDYINSLYFKAKDIYKNKPEFKAQVSIIKSKKLGRGLSKKEKIEFGKTISNELVILLQRYDVLHDIIESYQNLIVEIKDIESWNKYEQWIDWALYYGEDSYLATHISKLGHSSSKGSSVDVRFHDSCKKYNSKYLTTDTPLSLDTAYPDNKYSSISKLYTSVCEGKYIGDLLREDGRKYLSSFTSNNSRLEFWKSKFSTNIVSKNKRSYFLSKQTYYPIDDGHYHLLLPLKSSSLIHALHLEHKKYWDDEERETARKQKSAKKYSSVETISYPNKAYLHVTGSNHSNASSLNGQRGGRISLLPTMPPQWRSSRASYVKRTSVFDKTLSYVLTDDINDLKKYLLLLKNKKLSMSKPVRDAAVMRKLQTISEHFFDYTQSINMRESEEGWTCNSQLPTEQQLLLEPWRDDEIAKKVKINKEWQERLSKSYGKWLNNQLKKKSALALKPIHTELWGQYFLNDLREFVATQEAVL